jgi:hypothetical protein
MRPSSARRVTPAMLVPACRRRQACQSAGAWLAQTPRIEQTDDVPSHRRRHHFSQGDPERLLFQRMLGDQRAQVAILGLDVAFLVRLTDGHAAVLGAERRLMVCVQNTHAAGHVGLRGAGLDLAVIVPENDICFRTLASSFCSVRPYLATESMAQFSGVRSRYTVGALSPKSGLFVFKLSRQ